MKVILGKIEFGVIPLLKSNFMGIGSMKWEMPKEDVDLMDIAIAKNKRFTLSTITDKESSMFVKEQEDSNLSSKEQLVLLLQSNNCSIVDDGFGKDLPKKEIEQSIVADDFYIITL